MKKLVIMALTMLTFVAVSAQEKMKVEYNGTITEYEVRKITRVFFEGQDLSLTSGTAENITENSATIAYTVANANGNVSAGIILSTNSDVNYSNKQKEVLKSSSNGTNTVVIDGLVPSITYYYKAFAEYNGDYYYGEERSFTTAAHVDEILYREPYTAWGATKAQTKAYMLSYSLYQETATQLTYIGNNKEVLIAYSFNGDMLTSAVVAIPDVNANQSVIDAHLTENGYSYMLTDEDDDRVYLSADFSTIVYLHFNANANAYYVYYYKFEVPTMLYEEPYLNWGATMAVVKLAMSGRGYTLDDSSDTYLAYQGEYQELFSMYYFESSQLSEVMLAFLPSSVSVDDVREYMTSELEYAFVASNDAQTQFIYLTSDQKSVAVVQSITSDEMQLTIVDYISTSSLYSGVKSIENGNGNAGVFGHIIPHISAGSVKKALKSVSTKIRDLPKPEFFIINQP